jgi:hypothetical protein
MLEFVSALDLWSACVVLLYWVSHLRAQADSGCCVCRGAHLCESCCRREHEAEIALGPSSNHAVQTAR